MAPYPRTWCTLDEGSSWDEWIPRFVQYVHQSGLNERLPELMGKRLACDCSFEEVCEADILAGLVFEECVQQSAAHSQHDGRTDECRDEEFCWHGAVCQEWCRGGVGRKRQW